MPAQWHALLRNVCSSQGKLSFLRLNIMNRIDKILRSLSYINNVPTKQTKKLHSDPLNIHFPLFPNTNRVNYKKIPKQHMVSLVNDFYRLTLFTYILT